MGATRNVALNELPFRGISINAEADNVVAISVEASDSGVLFINHETGGTVTYTLPTASEGAGKWWWFFQGTATEIKIANDDGTAIIVGDSTNKVMTGSSGQGACGIIFGDGTYYYFIEIYGSWACGSS